MIEEKKDVSYEEGMRILEEERPLNPTGIKNSCIVELQRFINMRGTIDKETGKVHLPLLSVTAKNTESTIKKVQTANELITHLAAANSVAEIKEILEQAPENLGDDFDAIIGKCMTIIEITTNLINRHN